MVRTFFDRLLTVTAGIMTAVAVVVVVTSFRDRRTEGPPAAIAQVSATEARQWLGGRLILGDPEAPVALVVFSDLMCPYCQKFASDYSALLASRKGSLRVVFRHLPLTVLHARAREWATGASCAGLSGHFTEFHDLAFELQHSLDSASVWQVAKRAGVSDSTAFQGCLESREVDAEVTADSLAASRLGVTGTPTFVVGSHRFVGSPGREVLDSLIRVSLKE